MGVRRGKETKKPDNAEAEIMCAMIAVALAAALGVPGALARSAEHHTQGA
jgi:hypothetical protein